MNRLRFSAFAKALNRKRCLRGLRRPRASPTVYVAAAFPGTSMSWPISQDYNEAIQSPRLCFADADLKSGEVAVNALGLPQPCSGNFADVYRVNKGDKSWAVKCFTRPVKGLQERYAIIDKRLRAAELPFTVDFRYLAEGIRVRGQWYPVVKMEWVEGFALNRFVADNRDQPVRLEALFQIWLRLSKRLRETDIAHADLQHGNVLLVPGSRAQTLGLKLIDYDGMWVPELADQPSGELGHAAYQHPQRLKEQTYNRNLDRFPHLVIGTALLALVIAGPGMWEQFDNGDNLLFRESDLRSPESSPVFKALWALGNPTLCHLVGRLALACWRPLDQAPWLDELMASPQVLALKPAEERVVTQRLQVRTASRPGQAAAPNVFADLAHEPIERQAHPGFADSDSSKIPYIIAGAAVALGGLVVLAGGIAVALMSGGSKSAQMTERSVAVEPPPPTTPASIPVPVDPRPPSPPPVKPKDLVPPPVEPVKVPAKPVDFADLPRLIAAAGDAGSAVMLASAVIGLPEPGPKLTPKNPLPETIEGVPAQIRAYSNITAKRLALHPDGARLLAAGGRRTVQVLDLKTGKLIRELEGHAGDVAAVAVSPDGKLAVSCDDKGTAIVWNLENYSVAYKYTADASHQFYDCTYDGDGKAAFFVGPKLGLHVLDIYSGKPKVIGDVKGKVVAAAPKSRLVAVGGSDATLTVLDFENPDAPKKFILPPPNEKRFSIGAIAFSPDGQALAAACDDRIIRLWGVDKRSVVKEILTAGTIKAMAFSPDSRRLAFGGLDHALNVYLVKGNALRLPKDGKVDRAIDCMTFTPDGGRAFLGFDDNTIRLWRLPK
jgi:hypothetical protein